MKEFSKRAFYGTIYVVIMLAGLLYSELTFHILFVVILILSIHEMIKLTNKKNQVFAITYVLFPLVLVHFIKIELILLMFLFTWIFDTFAYLVGVSIGKKRIMPKISPKKSWEGFFGGLIATFIISWVILKPIITIHFSWIIKIYEDPNTKIFIVFALIIPFTATAGDLIESYYKRIAKVKDSGKLIPGHGGILDRMDAFLITIPILFIYSKLIL